MSHNEAILSKYKRIRERYPDPGEIPKKQFEELNEELSGAYKQARTKKPQYVQALYELDISLFRTWNVFDPGRRLDFAQDAFLALYGALQKFQPGRGSWLHYLKKYCVKTLWVKEQGLHEKGKREVEMSPTLTHGSKPEDPLFLKAVKDSIPEWELFKKNFFDEYSMKEIKEEAGKSVSNLKRIRKKVFDKCLELKNLNEQNPHKNVKLFFREPTPIWMTMQQFADRTGYAYHYVRKLVRPGKREHWKIDTRDINFIPTPRIRFLETVDGWILPRFKKIKYLGK